MAVEAVLKQNLQMRRLTSRPLISLEHKVFELIHDDGVITCVLAVSPHMGRLESAVSATIACIEFKPKFVLLVGIAGGFREGRWKRRGLQMNLGDVLIAEELFDVETRKVSSRDDVHVRPRVLYLSDPELRIAHAVSESNWRDLIPSQIRGQLWPLVHFGPIVSGDILLASDDFPQIAKLYQSDMFMKTGDGPIGIEMEGSGVALAVQRCNPRTGFLMVRGVSDYADRSKKHDEAAGRKLAAYCAASFAVSTIISRPLRSFLQQSIG